jgi:flavorubredoxin
VVPTTSGGEDVPITPTHQPPSRIASDTFVVHAHSGEAPFLVPINSLVIRGREPMVVDTGLADDRRQFLDDVASVVDLDDIRWIFLSHDDIDHTGNLDALLAAAPRATLVISWYLRERLGSSLDVAAHRTRWVGDGEGFTTAGRSFVAVRPPVFDAPTTRGLFDTSTGVYWAADAFASPMPTPVADVEQLDPTYWHDTMATAHQYLSPWFALLDDAKYQRTVSRVEALGVTTIAGAHTPAIGASHVAQAFEQIRTFASVNVPPQPGQEVLDQLLRGESPAA